MDSEWFVGINPDISPMTYCGGGYDRVYCVVLEKSVRTAQSRCVWLSGVDLPGSTRSAGKRFTGSFTYSASLSTYCLVRLRAFSFARLVTTAISTPSLRQPMKYPG